MRKKSLSTLKLSAAAAILAAGVGVSGITSEAAFDAPYYNINENGGSFNGSQYTLADGTMVTDTFFCDGTYTYFLQTDGTPMKDRLTYHPDGQADHVIYFDADGHECFDTFANVKKSIAGTDVDDLCYFGSLGYLYVNVITYNKAGTAIYYANEYGVMERNGVFEVRSDATNYAALANGCKYGYANSDGTVKGFYATYEEAAAQAGNGSGSTNQQGSWECYERITYDSNDKMIDRVLTEGNTVYKYAPDSSGNEHLYMEETTYADGYIKKTYTMANDGTTYLSTYTECREPVNADWTYTSMNYDSAGQVTESTIQEYDGSKIVKETSVRWDTSMEANIENVTVYNYTNGKLTSYVRNTVNYGLHDINGNIARYKNVGEYDENENLKRFTDYYYNEVGVEVMSGYRDFSYITVAGKEVLERTDYYGKSGKVIDYDVHTYDAYGNETSVEYYADYFGAGLTYRYGREFSYTYVDNEWIQTRWLEYSARDGQKFPNYGSEKVYENGRLVRELGYTGTTDNGWDVTNCTDYTDPGSYSWPQDTTQTASFESSKIYDPSTGTVNYYTIDNYRFVQK